MSMSDHDEAEGSLLWDVYGYGRCGGYMQGHGERDQEGKFLLKYFSFCFFAGHKGTSHDFVDKAGKVNRGRRQVNFIESRLIPHKL